MTKQESLWSKIDGWAEDGLISPEQAEVLKQREAAGAAISPARRVKTDEIFVYLGSLVVFLALAFLVVLNWRALGSAGRILSVAVPTVAMFGLGWRLRASESARLRRGAQARGASVWQAAGRVRMASQVSMGKVGAMVNAPRQQKRYLRFGLKAWSESLVPVILIREWLTSSTKRVWRF